MIRVRTCLCRIQRLHVGVAARNRRFDPVCNIAVPVIRRDGSRVGVSRAVLYRHGLIAEHNNRRLSHIRIVRKVRLVGYDNGSGYLLCQVACRITHIVMHCVCCLGNGADPRYRRVIPPISNVNPVRNVPIPIIHGSCSFILIDSSVLHIDNRISYQSNHRLPCIRFIQADAG
ncbi:hypothetical protein D3C81_1211200 [compost metagenome]